MRGHKKGVQLSWIKRCGKNKRKGGICNAVMMKNGKGCAIHGGKVKTGMSNANTSEMPRYTQAVQGTKLAERYDRAKKDAALLELHEEIALIQAVIEDLLSRFEDGDSRVTIKNLVVIYEQMTDAALNKKWATYNKRVEELGDLIKMADKQFAIVEDIKSAVKLKKELVESQSKREIQLEQMMKAEDVMLLMKVVLGEIRGVIYDRLDDKSVAGNLLSEISEKVAGHLRGNARNRNSTALPEG